MYQSKANPPPNYSQMGVTDHKLSSVSLQNTIPFLELSDYINYVCTYMQQE